MGSFDLKILLYYIFACQTFAYGQNENCLCTTEEGGISCHCEGTVTSLPIDKFPGTLHKLSFDKADISEFLRTGIYDYRQDLTELVITRSKPLESMNNNLFQDMPRLNILRVTHTALKTMPHVSGIGLFRVIHIIDFESNRIQKISSNSVAVRAVHCSLDYNEITSVEDWAFNGSQIEKLSFRGNTELHQLFDNSFNGIRSLRELDLSETSITFLPTLGLENLEILRLVDTFTLKVIPSVYYLSNLQVAQLTYSFHCCAFQYPHKHDPKKYEEYRKLQEKYCDDDGKRLTRDMFESSFGEFVDNAAQNESLYEEIYVSGDLIEKKNEAMQVEGQTDETFHQTSAEIPKGKIHAICGNLIGKVISCVPEADALNPCEDMMTWTWLRISVWFVLSTAIVGNIIVIFVLTFSRSEKTVPRFLMGNLAFADLLIGLYLAMLAIMDLVSTDRYFNYAYDWQRGYGCKISGFLTVFANQLSHFTLSVLTLERWFAIRHALYLNRLDLKLTRSIMICGWMYALLMAVLPLFGVSNYSSTSICLPMDTNSITSKAYVITVILLAGGAFFLMCVCYAQIYQSLSEETRHSIGEGSIARKMTILVGTNFICWAPVAFFSLTAVTGYPLITVSQSKILLVFVYPINSCANPYLYAILTKQFRKDCTTLFQRYICCKKSYHKKMGYSRPTTNDTPGPITTAETLL